MIYPTTTHGSWETKPPGAPRFSLDTKSGVPFYKQIILQIEMAIADGRLAPGAQLPTVRGLAMFGDSDDLFGWGRDADLAFLVTLKYRF